MDYKKAFYRQQCLQDHLGPDDGSVHGGKNLVLLCLGGFDKRVRDDRLAQTVHVDSQPHYVELLVHVVVRCSIEMHSGCCFESPVGHVVAQLNFLNSQTQRERPVTVEVVVLVADVNSVDFELKCAKNA